MENVIENFTLALQGFPQYINSIDPASALEAALIARLADAAGKDSSDPETSVQLLRWAIVSVDRDDPAGGFTCEGAYQPGGL